MQENEKSANRGTNWFAAGGRVKYLPLKDRQEVVGVVLEFDQEEAGRKIGAGKSDDGFSIFLRPFFCQY